MPAGCLSGEVSSYLAKVAVKTSIRVDAKAIIADTIKGSAIRDMSAYRGFNPIFSQCYSIRTMRELALSYGVVAVYMEKKSSVDEFLYVSLKQLLTTNDLEDNDIVIVVAGNFSRGTGFSFIEVGTVDYLKGRVSMRDSDLMA